MTTVFALFLFYFRWKMAANRWQNQNWNFVDCSFGIVHEFNYVLSTLLLPLPLLIIMMTMMMAQIHSTYTQVFTVAVTLIFETFYALFVVHSFKLRFFCSFIAAHNIPLLLGVYLLHYIWLGLYCTFRSCTFSTSQNQISEDEQNETYTHSMQKKRKKIQWPNI